MALSDLKTRIARLEKRFPPSYGGVPPSALSPDELAYQEFLASQNYRAMQEALENTTPAGPFIEFVRDKWKQDS